MVAFSDFKDLRGGAGSVLFFTAHALNFFEAEGQLGNHLFGRAEFGAELAHDLHVFALIETRPEPARARERNREMALVVSGRRQEIGSGPLE